MRSTHPRPRVEMSDRLSSLAGAGLALLALSCAGDRQAPPGPSIEASARPATAVVAISGDITGVNPLVSGGRVTHDILDQVFLRLFAEQPDFAAGPPSFEPRLARSWSWSDGGRTLTLELEPAATWSDGVAVTAADIVWSLDAAGESAIAWSHAATRERIVDYRALGERTVEVRFRNDYPGRLSDLNETPILPRHAWGEVPFGEWRKSGDWFRRNLVASGPFVLSAWRPEREVVLERNPSYYREGRPHLDRVIFRVVPERANRLELLLSGGVDFVSGLRPSAAQRVAASDVADLATYWNRQYHFIVWNGCREPLDDPVVRRALTLALDRESLLQAVYGDFARLAVSPVPSNAWVFDRDLEPWPWDPAEARRLLASRGFVDRDGDGLVERDGETLAVTLATNVGNGMRVDMATLAQTQLRDVGIDAELDFRQFTVFMASLRRHEFSAGLASWSVDTSFDLKGIFHSAAIDGGHNYGCYRSPEVDRQIDLAREQTDLVELKRHLIEVQRAVHRDQPYTFLAEVQRLSGVGRRLRGVQPNALDAYGSVEDWALAVSD